MIIPGCGHRLGAGSKPLHADKSYNNPLRQRMRDCKVIILALHRKDPRVTDFPAIGLRRKRHPAASGKTWLPVQAETKRISEVQQSCDLSKIIGPTEFWKFLDFSLETRSEIF
jgi:hypothetical protein